MSWKTFEEECTSYLNRKYGIKFEQQGESDSTVSDILYCGEKKCFYIEAKMPNAQCGQLYYYQILKKVYSSILLKTKQMKMNIPE